MSIEDSGEWVMHFVVLFAGCEDRGWPWFEEHHDVLAPSRLPQNCQEKGIQ